MSLIKVLEDYQHGRVDAITTIRNMTGAINKEYIIETLAIVNLITRIEQGDASKDMISKLLEKESYASNEHTN